MPPIQRCFQGGCSAAALKRAVLKAQVPAEEGKEKSFDIDWAGAAEREQQKYGKTGTVLVDNWNMSSYNKYM